MWLRVVYFVAIATYVAETEDVCLNLTLSGVLISANQEYEGSYIRSLNTGDYCLNANNGYKYEATYIQEANSNLYLFYVAYSYSVDGGWRFDRDVCQYVPGKIASTQHSYEAEPTDVPGGAWVEWDQTSTSFVTNTGITVTCTETGPHPLVGVTGTSTTTTTATSTTSTTQATTTRTTTAATDIAALIGGVVGGLSFAGIVVFICFAVFRDKCGNSYDETYTEPKRENNVGDVYVNALKAPQAPADSRLLANGAMTSTVPMFVQSHKNTRFDAFISYREDTGSYFASLVRMHLEFKGLRCVTQTMPDGQIDPSLEKDIALSSNFLIILSAGALDNCQGDEAGKDRVHVAAATALRMQKRIISLIDVKSFKWPRRENLPLDMRDLPLHNGINWVHGYQAACLTKLVTFLKSKN